MAADALIALAGKLDIDHNVELTEGREVVLDVADEEELSSQCLDVEFVLAGDGASAGAGVLYLTTRQVIAAATALRPRVVWVSSQPAGPAFALRYQQIIMHAISRDPSSYAKPCIYLQLDEGSEDMMQEEEGEGEAEEEVAAEIRLVPADEGKIDDIFKVLCDCAALNPDSEVEGEGDFFFDEAEVMAGLDPTTRAAVIADRLEGGMDLGGGAEGEAEANGAPEDLRELVGDDPSRFEDDEEEEEEGAAAQGGGAAGR
ncbi:Chloride conductance regulatory protein ICln [Tetrabaena socialis]|uniref:Chloride conductance regulatory protein ICln n=1 Tax=Tetrabaena socialis TaxID=47790 RepID=A0A2J8A8Q2_9CHLO|nr:Chloride conductance regulatory protein ICln [Tetrabaena socialis]|eukprot:PNH08916.1 Chloride conductance regulatory protein ICln [Tetrabaena socialis]